MKLKWLLWINYLHHYQDLCMVPCRTVAHRNRQFPSAGTGMCQSCAKRWEYFTTIIRRRHGEPYNGGYPCYRFPSTTSMHIWPSCKKTKASQWCNGPPVVKSVPHMTLGLRQSSGSHRGVKMEVRGQCCMLYPAFIRLMASRGTGCGTTPVHHCSKGNTGSLQLYSSSLAQYQWPDFYPPWRHQDWSPIVVPSWKVTVNCTQEVKEWEIGAVFKPSNAYQTWYPDLRKAQHSEAPSRVDYNNIKWKQGQLCPSAAVCWHLCLSRW